MERFVDLNLCGFNPIKYICGNAYAVPWSEGLTVLLKRGTYFIMSYVLLSSCIRGISGHLGANTSRREIDKNNDFYTVSVMKGREVVDHVPCKLTHKISRIF